MQLDPEGIAQSERLARALGELPVHRVFVSPLERCLQTISPWLKNYGAGIAVQSDPRIIEPDYGLWSGRKLDDLAVEKLWQEVQHNPASVHFPQGERFLDVWERVGSFYDSLAELASNGKNILVISHGDIIKFLVARILKMQFENFQSLTVEPASISVARFSELRGRLLQFNRTDTTFDTLFDGFDSAEHATLGGEHGSKAR